MEKLITDFLNEAEINFQKETTELDDIIFSTELSLDPGTFYLSIILDKESNLVSIFMSGPVKVPEDKRVEVSEYITRANFKNYEGSLVMNFDDGNLAFSYCLRFDEDSDTQHIWFQLNTGLAIAIDEMELHFPGILSVIYNDTLSSQAISKAEYGSNHKLN